MLPSIALAHSVEMVRDGGSLCASFQGANGSQYWLVLPVILERNQACAYVQPVIVERSCTSQEIRISWPHAKSILYQVETLLRENARRDYVERMYEVIHNEGRIG